LLICSAFFFLTISSFMFGLLLQQQQCLLVKWLEN
jgi:hypothetical protein